MAEISAHHHHHPIIRPGGGVALFVGSLLFVVMAMLGWGLIERGAGYAEVLVSTEDCRRAFNDEGCRAIVERAQAIHASTAPSFERLDTCEMVYGTGNCAMLKQTVIELHRYAPRIVAIALTSDRDTVVPLYYGGTSAANPDSAQAGRLVYFHGAPVGRLMQPKIGGADAPFITDAVGKPLTVDAIRALGRK